MPNLRLCRVEGSGFGGLIWSLMGKIEKLIVILATYVLVRFGEFGRSGTGQLHRVRPPPAQ